MILQPTQDEQRLLARVLDEAKHHDRIFFNALSDHEQQAALAMLRELRLQGNSPTLDQFWEIDYERRPLTVAQFFDDPYHCGKFLHENLYDVWRQDMQDVVEGHCIEWILAGAIGVGKTTVAMAFMLYMIQRLLCMRDPCGYYKTPAGIVFAFFSIIVHLAKSVEYNILTTELLDSEFFRSLTAVDEDKRRTEQNAVLLFPKNIKFAFGSKAVHTLGQNVYAGVMDEVAFAGGTENSQMVTLYNNVRRRMESRFMDEQSEDQPGVLCIVSSANREGDFLDTHIKAHRDDPMVHISTYARWHVKPFPGPWFRVQVGDKLHASRVLDVVEESVDRKGERKVVPQSEPALGANVVEVPAQFYQQFVEDIEGALRDIAGVSIFTSNPVFPHREKIYACATDELPFPFTVDEPRVHIHSDIELEHVFKKEALFKCVDPFRDVWQIIRHPASPRFVHVDLGLKHDSCGIAICHIAGVKTVTRLDNQDKAHQEVAPMVEFDLVVRIPPTPNSEIDIAKVRSFIFFLIKLGMPVQFVSYDGFASEESLQVFVKASIEAKRISVDKDPAAYLSLKSAIMEERARYYGYEPMMRELAQLQRVDPKPGTIMWHRKFKIDHPPKGSKDASDAAAGACYMCVTSKFAETQLLSPEVLAGAKEAFGKPPLQIPAEPISWAIRDHDEADVIAKYLDGGF